LKCTQAILPSGLITNVAGTGKLAPLAPPSVYKMFSPMVVNIRFQKQAMN